MRKVLVLGCPGSGKSLFSIALGKKTGLPVIHLDSYYWKPGWVPTPEDRWREVVTDLVTKHDQYIMDGNYSRTLDIRMKKVDTIFYFDFPRLICLYRVVKRRIQHRGQTRADMGEGSKEKIGLEFLMWIWNFKKRNQHQMENLLRDACLNKRQVIVFKKPKEAQAYLAKLATDEEKTVHDG